MSEPTMTAGKYRLAETGGGLTYQECIMSRRVLGRCLAVEVLRLDE